MSIAKNWLDQALDVAGSLTHKQDLVMSEEPLQLGSKITGQSGSSASITESGGTVTISGLTGITSQSVGRFLTISDAATAGNNGTFLIIEVNSATSVDISNASGATDANNGSISWVERNPYSLEDDINYFRTDRVAIKGTTNYYDDVPTYFRCNDQTTPIAANLSNIAGHTTDAKALVVTRKFENADVEDGYEHIMVSISDSLPYADAVNRLGVPIHDGYDINNHEATYCEIIDPDTGAGLEVLSGVNAGNRIFGRARQGVNGVDGDSFEVELRSVPDGSPISSSIAYTWEVGQPTVVDIYYPFRECLASMPETALRTMMVHGLVADADLSKDILDIREAIGISDNTIDLSGLLTNTTDYYPFSDLPDITPSVVEALNTLNEQIGSREYNGSILTDGYTITESLQELADAIESAQFSDGYTVTRTIERVSVDINAGSVHNLPGGLSYTVDPLNNGRYMSVYWRGLLRDPGPVVDGNNYEETSPTSITVYEKIKSGDHINYFIINV